MFWLIPVVCAAIAAGCVVAGALAVTRARIDLRSHADRLQAALPVALVDPNRIDAVVRRLNGDLDTLQALVARLRAAVREIAVAAEELRLREAIVAIRVAVAAVRALHF